MARNSNDLFDRATAEIHALGDEITERKSAEAGGNTLTAEMRAASAMLRAGLECHGKEARGLSLNVLVNTLNAVQDCEKQPARTGPNGLEIRAQADKMVQALLDVERTTR